MASLSTSPLDGCLGNLGLVDAMGVACAGDGGGFSVETSDDDVAGVEGGLAADVADVFDPTSFFLLFGFETFIVPGHIVADTACAN